MKRWLIATIVAGGCLLPAPGFGAALEEDLGRVVGALYIGVVGAVTGDVNADGAASAADVSATLGGSRNPTWPGPFRIGVTEHTLVKTSLVTQEARALRTTLWYPTDATGRSDPRGGIPDAPFPEMSGPLPVVIFSHGSCGFPEQSIFFTVHLASYGFIVAAPAHVGNTIADENCRSLGEQKGLAESFIERPADVSFVIDELFALGDDALDAFFGVVDPSRVGMSGHSFGGQTTLRVAAAEPRIIAGLALAPVFRIPETPDVADAVEQIDVPLMIQGGAADSVTPFDANQQAPFDLLSPPRYLVKILNTGHYAFSDGCAPGALECAPERLSSFVAHQYVLRYGVAFLVQWVAGDARFAPFLDPAADPPGVELTADLG